MPPARSSAGTTRHQEPRAARRPGRGVRAHAARPRCLGSRRPQGDGAISHRSGLTPLRPELPEVYIKNSRKGGSDGPSSAQAAQAACCQSPLGAVAPLVAVRLAAVAREGRRKLIDLRHRILTRSSSKSASVTSRAGALARLRSGSPAVDAVAPRKCGQEATQLARITEQLLFLAQDRRGPDPAAAGPDQHRQTSHPGRGARSRPGPRGSEKVIAC